MIVYIVVNVMIFFFKMLFIIIPQALLKFDLSSYKLSFLTEW